MSEYASVPEQRRLVSERADALPVLAEVFLDHGYDGASLSMICRKTGLGKGSLYHFFPGGKEEMASAVLAEIDVWFELRVFTPLRDYTDPLRAMRAMLGAVETYFHSGHRVCLVGLLSLGSSRDRFAAPVRRHFVRWVYLLAGALIRAGHPPIPARGLAESTVAEIQGALVLARAWDDPGAFTRALRRLRDRLESR